MTQEHPITPPPELLKHWEDQHFDESENYDVMLIQAYQAGADQELEACYQEVQKLYGVGSWLRSLRRPKPPSLKEEAIDTLHLIRDHLPADLYEKSFLIRRALESLPD